MGTPTTEKQPTCGVIKSDKVSLCGNTAIAFMSLDEQEDGFHICQHHCDRLFNEPVAFAFVTARGKRVMIRLKSQQQDDTLEKPQP